MNSLYIGGQVLRNGLLGMSPKLSRWKIPHSEKTTYQDLSIEPYGVCVDLRRRRYGVTF